jgi:hypothetical protein
MGPSSSHEASSGCAPPRFFREALWPRSDHTRKVHTTSACSPVYSLLTCIDIPLLSSQKFTFTAVPWLFTQFGALKRQNVHRDLAESDRSRPLTQAHHLPQLPSRLPSPHTPWSGRNGQEVAPSSALGPVLRLPRGTHRTQRRQARRAAPHGQALNCTPGPSTRRSTSSPPRERTRSTRPSPWGFAGERSWACVGRTSISTTASSTSATGPAPPWRPVRRRPQEPSSSHSAPTRPLHRAPALAPPTAGGRSRQGGGDVAGVGLRLRHPNRPPCRAAQPVSLLHASPSPPASA